ncbi:MAG: hypothetical protein Q7U39_00860 [Nitrospira sp.]|nr:hypothetical protein [Nitrospira sp.]
MTDDTLAVGRIGRVTARRMKTVSRMNVCVWSCAILIGVMLG